MKNLFVSLGFALSLLSVNAWAEMNGVWEGKLDYQFDSDNWQAGYSRITLAQNSSKLNFSDYWLEYGLELDVVGTTLYQNGSAVGAVSATEITIKRAAVKRGKDFCIADVHLQLSDISKLIYSNKVFCDDGKENSFHYSEALKGRLLPFQTQE